MRKKFILGELVFNDFSIKNDWKYFKIIGFNSYSVGIEIFWVNPLLKSKTQSVSKDFVMRYIDNKILKVDIADV